MAEPLNQKDKIQILMEEYKVLRAEIATRTGYGFQISTVSAAAVTWLFGQVDITTWRIWLGFAVILVAVVWASFLNVRDIWKASARVRELEHEVNSRAGEHLLVWERLFGAANMG